MTTNSLRTRFIHLLSRLRGKPPAAAAMSSTSYWTRHNVTQHLAFANADESLAYFHWRNAQYFGYLERMPVAGQDGKVVLDYGCGPGNDLVGFGAFSAPARLIGMDVSATSLAEARRRVALHGIKAELVQIQEADPKIPLPDASVDHIHSSGVLHHVPDPLMVLREFRRLLRPGGEARVMVYNYDCILLHLYVAYVIQRVEKRYPGLDTRAAFAKCTDGVDCPIARVCKPAEFLTLVGQAGLAGRFTGAALSVYEASLLPQRFAAIMDRELAPEHRDFLLALEVDRLGLPRFGDHYAGVDGCYVLTVPA